MNISEYKNDDRVNLFFRPERFLYTLCLLFYFIFSFCLNFHNISDLQDGHPA